MKLTFLGSGAAEGMPAIFCNCEVCRESRRLGGKNFRTRSQSLINDDLLIDFPADTYSHFQRFGIEGDTIKYLIITHPHQDHFYPNDLLMRTERLAHGKRVPVLKILCSEAASKKFREETPFVDITPIKAYEKVTLGDYRITALPARHMNNDGEALIYIIEGEKTLFYAHDTGYFHESVFENLEENRVKLDMISLDCTNVLIPIEDTGNHMGFPNVERVLARLTKMGALSEKCIKYVNHFSHNGNPLQEFLEKEGEKHGLSVSYDGCAVLI